MGSYSKNDIILVRYPFSDLSGSKVGKDSGVRKDLLIFGYKEAMKAGISLTTETQRTQCLIRRPGRQEEEHWEWIQGLRGQR